jgi:hypothetical protein
VTDESYRTADLWVQRDLDAAWSARVHVQRRMREMGGVAASSNLAGLSLVYTRSNF